VFIVDINRDVGFRMLAIGLKVRMTFISLPCSKNLEDIFNIDDCNALWIDDLCVSDTNLFGLGIRFLVIHYYLPTR